MLKFIMEVWDVFGPAGLVLLGIGFVSGVFVSALCVFLYSVVQ